jgi:hypothetical protein
MSRSLIGVDVGDPLVSPTADTDAAANSVDEYVVVAVDGDDVHVLPRYLHDRDLAPGYPPHRPILVVDGVSRRTGRQFFTRPNWDALVAVAQSRRRFSKAVGSLSSTVYRLGLIDDWGAHLQGVADNELVALFDELAATIESRRERWATSALDERNVS